MTALGWVCVAFAVMFYFSVYGAETKFPHAAGAIAFACSLGALGLAYLCFRAVACG